jgi:hypothetical protein
MAATPKWATGDAVRVGRAALALATEKKAELDQRLPAGLRDGLCRDLDDLEGKQSASTLAKESLREATRTQNEAAEAVNHYLVLARGALVRAAPPGNVRTAFGLSLRPIIKKISSLLAAVDAFLDGAKRFPDAVRAAGLLTADLDRLSALRASLSTADAKQETSKLTKKLPTIDRKQTQLRIEKAVDTIINAGVLAFADQPQVIALFRALVPGKAPAKKPAS